MNLQRSGLRLAERGFVALCLSTVILPLALLAILVGDTFADGFARLDWSFLVGYPSRKPELAGIFPAFVGTVYLIGLTALIALPIGVGAAIYLEEYGVGSRLGTLVEVNIANLAGVPSVIYGLLGLGVFVRLLELGRTLIAGALTMALLILPMLIMVSREALRTVPPEIREGCYALGATKWQTIRQVVLPTALPGILTGAILSISRAIGETAPLLVVGALAYVTFVPDGIDAPFTVLPIQIFNWVSRPQHEFLVNAAAGIVVLLVVMVGLNAGAIYLRGRLQRRQQ